VSSVNFFQFFNIFPVHTFGVIINPMTSVNSISFCNNKPLDFCMFHQFS
jgi:hypothetical protein